MLLALTLSLVTSVHAAKIDLNAFLSQLRSPAGVEIEVHGIDREAHRYVGTYREGDFFTFQHFGLVSTDPAIWARLATLNRHDVIRVKGNVPAVSRPFLHIMISEFSVVRSYSGGPGHFTHPVVIPDEIKNLNEMVIKVHAIHEDGRMLVADYKKSILPVLVPRSLRAAAKVLDRGDLLRVKFMISELPESPVHLSLMDEPDALTVLEHMSDLNGRDVTYEGALVLFPKSPQVAFDVFALQLDLGDGHVREVTLLFEDGEQFRIMRERLKAAWDAATHIPAVNDRNKWLKAGLRVRAKGRFTFVDPQQANPQIFLSSQGDLAVFEH